MKYICIQIGVILSSKRKNKIKWGHGDASISLKARLTPEDRMETRFPNP